MSMFDTTPLCHAKTHALKTKPKKLKTNPNQIKPKPPETNMLQLFKACSSDSLGDY